MVPLKYQKNENLEKKYYKLITQSRNERFIEEIDEKCQCYLKMPFKNLVCASPEELEQLHSNVKDRTDYGQMKDAFKHISSIKQNNYIVSILFQNMPKEAKLLIYEQVGQNVCLYCNRNFIEDLKIVKNRNGRKPVGTFELDHFYSKDEFPMFAVSFYNLIPVCGTCNRIKSNTVFNINPYLMYDKKDNISFEYNILGSNYGMPTDYSIAIGTYVVDERDVVPIFSREGYPIFLFRPSSNMWSIVLEGKTKYIIPHGWGQELRYDYFAKQIQKEDFKNGKLSIKNGKFVLSNSQHGYYEKKFDIDYSARFNKKQVGVRDLYKTDKFDGKNIFGDTPYIKGTIEEILDPVALFSSDTEGAVKYYVSGEEN